MKTKHEQENEAEKQQIKDNKKILDDKTKEKEKASKLEELEYEWVKDGFVIKKGPWPWSSDTREPKKCKKTLLKKELNKGDTLKAALKTITDEYEQKNKLWKRKKTAWINKLIMIC
ncbi:MAG: hypothetical protein U9532_03060 ['Conium maculatum' witches'-broom phytoplasma]|nr:hypothetical protein ['Conium maculatum' witches'-broom phytoplasma]